jgi:glycine betaine/proline transport system substrate-binding protein
LRFSLPLENEIMGRILDDGEEPGDAALAWLAANAEAVEPWLEGVTMLDGAPGSEAVISALVAAAP